MSDMAKQTTTTRTQYVVWVRWAGRSVSRAWVVQATDVHEAEDRVLAYLSEQHGHHIGYNNVKMNVEIHDDWVPDGAVIVPEPEPEPEPPTRGKQQPRQSREAQYNQRVQAAYESIWAMGHRHENDLHELFSVASQSTPGTRYQVTHDLVSGRMHCTCLAGVNERATCVHRVAVTRWLSERAVKINAVITTAADDATARQAAADRARDTSILRRDNRPFSILR